MAQFFKPQPKARPQGRLTLNVSQLDLHGVGVARHQGKAIFVEGALPGEEVQVSLQEEKKQFALARLEKVLRPADQRQTPFCPHYSQCGGCTLQHMPVPQQQQAKMTGIRELFARQAEIALPEAEAVIQGEAMGYRRVCRLAVKYDKKARLARLGFRRRQSNELVEVSQCPVLAPRLSALIDPLRALINSLKGFRDLGHLELYDTDSRPLLLVRHNGQPSEGDRQRLVQFAQQHELDCYLQTEGEPEPLLAIQAPVYGVADVRLNYLPGDFLQVNDRVNQALVATVLDWLAPTPDDKVLDLFCGLGNFTLPLARHCAEVVGVEGVPAMVARARQNALSNGIDNARFYCADLAEDFTGQSWAREGFDLVLLDPARPGAWQTIGHLCRLAPRRIVYVSCNPVTAARDCAPLQAAGYRVVRWRMLDMFPHTGHVESILLFEQSEQQKG